MSDTNLDKITEDFLSSLLSETGFTETTQGDCLGDMITFLDKKGVDYMIDGISDDEQNDAIRSKYRHNMDHFIQTQVINGLGKRVLNRVLFCGSFRETVDSKEEARRVVEKTVYESDLSRATTTHFHKGFIIIKLFNGDNNAYAIYDGYKCIAKWYARLKDAKKEIDEIFCKPEPPDEFDYILVRHQWFMNKSGKSATNDINLAKTFPDWRSAEKAAMGTNWKYCQVYELGIKEIE